MISKYRNLGIVYSALALALTVLFVVLLRKSMGFREESLLVYLIPVYLGAAILWIMASYTLAKAKGYGPDTLGRVLMVSILLGFCCQPLALVFPFIGFFLDDRTRPRRDSHRRRSSRRRGQ